jgi:protein-disulfide isomerase
MARSLQLLRAVALFAYIATAAACGRADAASRSAKADSATSTTAAVPVATNESVANVALMQKADRSRLQGPENAMWVVMISDFQCPYCKQWHDSSMAQLTRDYIMPGKIRFAYLHLPLESIHPHARAEAQASLCAGAQGKFWEYADALFDNYNTVKSMSDVSPLLSRLAKDLTLDVKSFDRCRVSAPIASLVSNDIAQASQAGVESTPSFIVGSFLVKGAMPYKDFRKAIDTALAVAKSAKAPRGAGTSAPTP